MEPSRGTVTRFKWASGAVPAWAGLFVILFRSLDSKGLTAYFKEKFHTRRKDGYHAFDAFVLILAWVCSGTTNGFGKFVAEIADLSHGLAGIAGRSGLPSQPSLSRVLNALSLDQVKTFVDDILGVSHDYIIKHHAESISFQNSKGNKMNVFHYDPRVRAFRQRALAEGPDLPTPERLPSGLVASGYTGRKRGETQFQEERLIHSGSGMWCSTGICPGNGTLRKGLWNACKAIERFNQEYRKEGVDALLVIDGVGGGYAQAAVSTEQSIPYLTRMNDYHRVKASAGWKNEKSWVPVRDGRSGPRREAAELGFLFYPGLGMVRTVVSRFSLARGKKSGDGFVVGAYQYEAFITSLPIEDLATGDAVYTYYARCGIENRFLQEDKERGGKRLFSRSPAGQLFAQAVRLVVWNELTELGAKAFDAGLDGLDELVRRTLDADPDKRNTMLEFSNNSASTRETTPLQQPSEPSKEDAVPPPKRLTLPPNLICPKLQKGFKLSEDNTTVLCPTNVELLCSRPKLYEEAVVLRFRPNKAACVNCPEDQRCFSSHATKPRRELRMTFRRAEVPEELLQNAIMPLPPGGPATQQTAAPGPEPWLPPEAPTTAAQPVQLPLLIPTTLRHLAESIGKGLSIQITLTSPPRPTPLPPYIAISDAARRHDRKSWAEKWAWNLLPQQAKVEMAWMPRSDWLWLIPGDARRYWACVASGGQPAPL